MASREKLRQLAQELFQRAVDAANPGQFVNAAIRYDDTLYEYKIKFMPDYLYFEPFTELEHPNPFKAFNPLTYEASYPEGTKFHVIALGKASVKMASAILHGLHAHISSFIIVTHEVSQSFSFHETLPFIEKQKKETKVIEVSAGHPFPNQSSVKAGQILLDKFRSAKEDEVILLLLSGGGSALAVLPADGIIPKDKITVTKLLFEAGADIHELNCVRKHLSKIKGGQLAQMTKARIHTITLSDVYDDDPASIASGIAYPDKTTFQEAYDIMHKYKLWDELPASVQERLQDGRDGKIEETPDDEEKFNHVLGYIGGSNKKSILAARQKAASISLWNYPITDEVKSSAKSMVSAIKNKEKLCIEISGGETTVNITGDGLGGRNQELALLFALQAEEQKLQERYKEWVFLSGGTDGRDGPTEAAGGVVDHQSLQRMRKAGIDPQKELDNNNSYHALKASDDLIPRRDTGTNVADIQVFIGDPQK